MISLPRFDRARKFWARHRSLFWTLHSIWALLTGVAVIVLARDRYGFIPWVVVFLALTWLSTMVIGWGGESDADEGPDLKQEVTGYFTRGLYQETLFFLLPFYAYSTVVQSTNVLFVVLIGGLALLSCLDLIFDRWMRTSPLFGLVFFSTVAFAAVNLLLPILFRIDPRIGTPLAAVIAITSSIPLAMKGSAAVGGTRIRLAGAALGLLVVAVGFPSLIPPVPLRLEEARFASGIERESLELSGVVEPGGSVTEGQLPETVVVLVEVFAPASVPTRVTLEWKRDGRTVRRSREVEITAHEWAFRVWDSWRPESGPVPPGDYKVVLRTQGRRVFGVAELTVLAEE